MLYAATAIWLIAIVLLAGGVIQLWSTLIRPRMINGILLPGTLIAQLGHVVALLITGATVNNTALMKDDGSAAPAMDPMPQPKLPVLGPVVVALLPMAALGACIYLLLVQTGVSMVAAIPHDRIAQNLPITLAAFWDQLRGLITLAEATLNAVWNAEANQWKVAAFVYFMICLSVRMGPQPGNLIGSVGAIAGMAVVAALAGTLSANVPQLISGAWPILAFTVGWLLLMLLMSLAARGIATAVTIVRGR